jgi:hypothetical protein
MAGLTATLQLSSTTLFPTPLDYTATNNCAINGDFNGFNTISVGTSNVKLNLATISGGTAQSLYSYFSIPAAAVTGVYVGYTGATPFLTLQPGDFAFLPIGSGLGSTSDIVAVNFGNPTAVALNFFIGERV